GSLASEAFALVGALALVLFVPLMLVVVSFRLPMASMNASPASFSDPQPGTSMVEAVSLARSRKGLPYIWGASGPAAFDCSGLVVWVYAQLGLQPPRTAQQQLDWSISIDPSQLAPGDLAFYQHTYPSEDRIT